MEIYIIIKSYRYADDGYSIEKIFKTIKECERFIVQNYKDFKKIDETSYEMRTPRAYTSDIEYLDIQKEEVSKYQ